MIKSINGQHYLNLLDYGIRNLAQYKEHVNALNVFPVPDGDTGTNMLMTLQNGYSPLEGSSDGLPTLAKRFSAGVVFGARGNSGVIASQFFKGFSDFLSSFDEAGAPAIIEALSRGVSCAYEAVSNPVEGTMLTVAREATDYVKAQSEKGNVLTVDDVIAMFLKQARRTLENTPDMLPVLKSAGVVDSGGAGLVFVFEGMQKYLRGEPLAEVITSSASTATVDFTAFDRNSKFDFGYCTEFVLQLTCGKCEFDYDAFREELSDMGDSIVTVYENDKVKVHIHTRAPEQVLGVCHAYGEFLTLKIENMNVQHHEYRQTAPAAIKLHGGENAKVAVVAVAHGTLMGERFLEMGADVVIPGDGEYPPSAQDFIEQYEKLSVETIIVFPNSNDTGLAAEQASRLYQKAKIIVMNTRADSQCYAALPLVDFAAEDAESMAEELQEAADNVTTVLIAKAQKGAQFDGVSIEVGDYFALMNKTLLAVGKDSDTVALEAIEAVLDRDEHDILTVFKGVNATDTVNGKVYDLIASKYPLTEADVMDTGNALYELVLSFE